MRMASVASALAIATLMCVEPVFAQEQPATASEPAEGIGDIVVTAEKRPSVLQKTAISISAIGSEKLAENGVANLSDLTALAPSVSFSLFNVATIVSIRGVSSRDASETGDPAVSISIDGFNLQRAIGLNAAMFDLDRVEVLRGPQGTLLGRNATGGAINLITAKPKDHFEAYAGADVGNYSTYGSKGMVNIPLTDNLQVRAAFQTRDHNGYRDNQLGTDYDDQHNRSFRVSAAYQPTPRLSILLTGEYTREDSNGPAINAIGLNYYTADNVADGYVAGDVDYTRPSLNQHSFAQVPGGYMRYNVWGIRSQIDYDMDFATLTYQGGYRHMDFNRAGVLGGVMGGASQNYSFITKEETPSWNHELRLSSNGNGPFKWQFGGYYFQEKNDVTNDFVDYPGSDGLYGDPVLLARYYYPDIKAEAKALFGQASYEIVPDLTFELGARYSHDEKSRHNITTTTNFGTYASSGCGYTDSCSYTTTNLAQSASSSKTTWHVGLNYQLTAQNMLYAKFDTGYKAGGFNNSDQYYPETIKAYEIGSKNRFFNNTLQVNLDAYYYDYSNQQVTQTVVTATTIGSMILNAGSSTYKGAEADILWQPTMSDRFNFYVGYNDAKYKNFATSVSGQLLRLAQLNNAAVPVYDSDGSVVSYNYQLKGNRPPQAPMWTINAGYEHDFMVFGGTLTPRVQTHFESKSYFSFYNLPLDRQDSYTKTDATITFKPESENWTLSAYVRNIENTVILANSASPPSTFFGTYRYQYAAPRTYGMSFTYNW